MLAFPYPDKHTAWALGNLMREAWLRDPMSGGELPTKALRTKTNDQGSHCFALYPEEFWPTMDRIINNTLDSDQGWLPFPEES